MERIEIKTPENQLRQEFIRGYGYPPKIADALVLTVQEFVKTNYHDRQQTGQIIYQAVAKEEPAGKPLIQCRMVSVKLSLFQKDDLRFLKQKGLRTLRRYRIRRLCNEALNQCALLTQEHLAELLSTSVRTIRSDIAELKQDGMVPTRGYYRDIGRGPSHKVKIVELWLEGYEYSEIMLKTGHSPESIQNYLESFKRVVYLQTKMDIPEIRQVTGLSERLIQDYQDIFSRHGDSERVKDMTPQPCQKKDHSKETEP